MTDSIRIKEVTTLKYQPNLGEDIEELVVEAGTEMVVLQEWENAWLVKDDEGHLFNVKKELADEA